MNVDLSYTALIRTHNSFPVVGQVIAALRAQKLAPTRILVVDSHSERPQKESLVPLVDVLVEYPDGEFNFSKAINIGVERCETPWVLIISSHVVLEDPTSIERATNEMRSVGAAAFYLHRSPDDPWVPEVIDEATFDGRNGLSNACAFVPVRSVAERPFREDVFSAEDQEWASHFLKSGQKILRIGIDTMKYLNPHSNERKYINEEVAIAYFAYRKRLGIRFLAGWLVRSAVYFAAGRRIRSKTYLTIFREVLRARHHPPVQSSRYF